VKTVPDLIRHAGIVHDFRNQRALHGEPWNGYFRGTAFFKT
jgi:hypothetical protein